MASAYIEEKLVPLTFCKAALALLLLISVPIFVCMPLTSDTVLYDLQARNVLHGGTLYRDILEPNLPGIVWLHLLIRTVAGWSSEAMRIADLIIVATTIWLFARMPTAAQFRSSTAPLIEVHDPDLNIRPVADSANPVAWLLMLLAAVFYLSRNEWCHCQRDIWMLLPVASALTIRVRRLTAPHTSQSPGLTAEGMCWGIAFWIKPHIAISVVPLLALDIGMSLNRGKACARVGLIILGGLLIAAPGILWLIYSGAWPHFLDMQLNWNPEYLAAGRDRRSWYRIWLMLVRLHPWWLVHVIAVPLALRKIRQVILQRRPSELRLSSAGYATTTLDTALLSATFAMVYLTWFLQASLLQHAMDYIQVPPVLLGLVFLSRMDWQLPVVIRRSAVVAFLLLALVAQPQLQWEKLQLWTRCFSEGSSWFLKNELACGRLPDWRQLEQVVKFLDDQQVSSGEVTCFNVHCIHVYSALGLQPSTRFVGISALLELFPSRRRLIERELSYSQQRFIVVDTDETPAVSDQFPWNQSLVFSAGNFQILSPVNSAVAIR